ncbi:MAG: glycosyltransferase family 39 protein, partial [Candidatus Aminicenantales bacterium]
MIERTASGPRRPRVPLVVLAAAAFVFFFSAGYSYFVFDHVPHIHDEISALFHARIFLGGHFTAPSPPARESFDFPHTINNGRWYSMYPPGWPFLLALGVLIRAPWLINPILGGLTILLLYFLGLEIHGRRTGVLAAVLGGVSIWLLLMSATMMSHPASMVFNAVFLLFFFRSLKRPNVRNGLLAGFAFGAAYLIRPYNTLVFSLPFLVVLLFRLLKEFKVRWKNALAMALPAALCGGFFLFFNVMTTGHAFMPGYLVYHGPQYAVIFGRPATMDFDFTPLVSAVQIRENMTAINDDLFGWPLTSLWLLVFTFWAALARPRERGPDLLLVCSFMSMTVGFFFFWGSFVIIGARMFFDSLPLLILLSARGLERAPSLLAGRFHRIGAAAWGKAIAGVLVLFTGYAFAVRFPAWTKPPGERWFYARYDHNFCGSTAWIDNAVRGVGLHNAVVVLKFLYGPLTGFPTGWWSSGFAYDTPKLDGDVIYANDCGPDQNRTLLRAFPGRAFYQYAGTLDKGVLAPLREEDGVVRPGPPIVPARTPRRSVTLLA